MAKKVKSCENCARMYLQQIHTNNAEEGVSGAYERYACKKGKRMIAGVCARKDLLKRSCGLWREEGTVLHTGDCFHTGAGENYVYCGKIGNLLPKRLLKKSAGYEIVKDDFLKGKKIYVYNYLPDLAQKRKRRYLEKIRSERIDS